MSTKLLDSKTLQENIDMLLTAKQVAEMVGVTEMTLYTWKRWRGLPFITIQSEGRASIRYHPKDIEEWLAREGLRVITPKLKARHQEVQRKRRRAPVERKRLAA